jgi:transcriptional regulator with XRE-family HTH domain
MARKICQKQVSSVLFGEDGPMTSEDWRRLADYVIARRVELGLRDRRALAAATGVTDRTLGKLENGQRVSASTLGVIENRLGWAPGSCRRILAGGNPDLLAASQEAADYDDPTLRHLASTPGLPPDVVRGLIALARNWRESDDGSDGVTQRELTRRRA